MKTVMMTHHGLCGGLNPGSASPPPAGSGTAASSGAPAAKACRASSRSTKGQSKPVFTPNAPGTGLASSKPAKAPPKAPAPPPAKAAAKAGGAASGGTACSSSEGEDTVKTPDRQTRHRAGHPRPWSKSGDPQKRPSNARDSRRQQADGRHRGLFLSDSDDGTGTGGVSDGGPTGTGAVSEGGPGDAAANSEDAGGAAGGSAVESDDDRAARR